MEEDVSRGPYKEARANYIHELQHQRGEIIVLLIFLLIGLIA